MRSIKAPEVRSADSSDNENSTESFEFVDGQEVIAYCYDTDGGISKYQGTIGERDIPTHSSDSYSEAIGPTDDEREMEKTKAKVKKPIKYDIVLARNVAKMLKNFCSMCMSDVQIRANDLAQLKGSSAWLTALPLAVEGYVLTKREFYDAIYLRYWWQLKRLPSSCACGKSFTVDHGLSCLKGGFIHRRHDEIRDLLAAAINDVAYDVTTEPVLAPLTGELLPPSANSADDARVDIAARSFWQRSERAFFDVRVFNPYALTHRRQTLSSSFNANEREKKRHYNQRIVEVEHGSFTPVVFSAFGGCGRETQHFLSFLAEKLAVKKNFTPSIVLSWLRRKIAFALLRAQIVCVRGSRTCKNAPIPSTSDIALSEWNSNIN